MLSGTCSTGRGMRPARSDPWRGGCRVVPHTAQGMHPAHKLNPDCPHSRDAECPYEAVLCWAGLDVETADGPDFRQAGHRCSRCEGFLERRRARRRRERILAGKDPSAGGAGATKTTGEFVAQAKQAHPGGVYDYSRTKYVTNDTKVQIVCRKHGPFWQAPNNHLSGRGCPRCRSSKGEKAVRAALRKAGLDFIEQWTGHDCRATNRLRFDFALPQLGVLIEFDGGFHRQAVRWPGQTQAQAEKRLRQIQFRDRVKDRWAKENGWTMVRIQHTSQVAGVVDSLLSRPAVAAAASQ